MTDTAAHPLDVVVVGGGPSGLAAATWLARYRRTVLVVDSGEHRADRVEASHGYLGRDPQRPRDLLSDGRREVLAYPTARIVDDCVEEITAVGDPREPRWEPTFRVRLTHGRDVVARRIVLACGVADAFPPVEGLHEHYGASVFHCPACDGYEARDRDVVALGWGEHLVGFARTLLGWARSVTVVTAGHRFVVDDDDPDDGERERREAVKALCASGIDVFEDDVVALVGPRHDLRAVRLASGREVACSLVFFSVAHSPRTDLARSLGCEIDDEGYVAVNDCNATTTPGVYAVGDLVPGLQLTSVATAKGVVAGIACAQSLAPLG